MVAFQKLLVVVVLQGKVLDRQGSRLVVQTDSGMDHQGHQDRRMEDIHLVGIAHAEGNPAAVVVLSADLVAHDLDEIVLVGPVDSMPVSDSFKWNLVKQC